MPDPAPVPVVPKTWTVQTIATLVSGAALFILGTLTQAGVTVPAHTSTEVQLFAGAIVQLGGTLTPLISLLSTHSVQKAAIRAGLPVKLS